MSGQSEQNNLAVIKNGYQAFAAGNIEEAMNMFDDDIEWVQPGNSAISGTYHGKAEVGQLLARLTEKSVTATPRRYLVDGEIVVALTDVTVGDELGRDADVFTVRNGKTVRVDVHTDTALMERVYGSKKLAAH